MGKAVEFEDWNSQSYFPDGSAVKNSPVNAGDSGSIPGSGRFPGEGNGNPLVFLPEKSHGQRSLKGQSMGLQGVGHDLATIQQQTNILAL